jgi:hypothetical protein
MPGLTAFVTCENTQIPKCWYASGMDSDMDLEPALTLSPDTVGVSYRIISS